MFVKHLNDKSQINLTQSQDLSRRRFLAGLASAGAAMTLPSSLTNATAKGSQTNGKEARYTEKNLYWGDLHNHNSVGYAKGSLERTYDIARSSLDFLCFTGHSQWHDMPVMPQNKHNKWLDGFKTFGENWAKVKRLANENNQPGKFASFIGYEWHSSKYGDVCIIFPGSEAKFLVADNIKELQKFAREQGAILIPHHPAYKQGWRGQNWSVLDTSVSPVIEIFSEHGNAESDRSLFDYIRHSMGGRYTRNTLQWLWEQGTEVGVVASTDDHLGYPGAYGEGLAAVYADQLSRESILEAIRARRTYGVSKDRIQLDYRLNGYWMGESIGFARNRTINVKVKGKDAIDRVEVLRNNQVIYRDHPIDRQIKPASWDRPVLCRVEFGWGPWAALDMARICDWKFALTVNKGSLVSATPCFQSGPFDEERRSKLTAISNNSCEVTSYTARNQAYEERATNSVVFEIQGSPQTQLDIQLARPKNLSITRTLQELASPAGSDVIFTSGFTSESMLLHRLVFADNYQTEFEFTDNAKNRKTDWYYTRVLQTNGSLAWSSPIWVSHG